MAPNFLGLSTEWKCDEMQSQYYILFEFKNKELKSTPHQQSFIISFRKIDFMIIEKRSFVENLILNRSVASDFPTTVKVLTCCWSHQFFSKSASQQKWQRIVIEIQTMIRAQEVVVCNFTLSKSPTSISFWRTALVQLYNWLFFVNWSKAFVNWEARLNCRCRGRRR